MTPLESILISDQLPRPSGRVAHVLAMLRDPDRLDIDELAEGLAGLPGFEGTVLSIINSPNFPLRREVQSLHDAVLFIGIRSLSYLLVARLTKGLLPRGTGRSQIFDREAYWKHCVGTSVAAMKLSDTLGVGDRYKLFTYGIVHDIGIAILDLCRPDLLDRLHDRLEEGRPIAASEIGVLGRQTHAEIGCEVLRTWGVAEEICEAVRYHERPRTLSQPRTDVDLLYLADAVSSDYYHRLLGLQSVVRADPEILQRLDVSVDDLEALSEGLAHEVEADAALLMIDEMDVLDDG